MLALAVSACSYAPTRLAADGVLVDDMPTACADGYVMSPQGQFYKLYSNRSGWDEAQARCVEDLAHLVVIDDAAEDAFVAGLHSDKFWIGANDRAAEGTFEWVTGGSLAYENWTQGQPDNGSNSEDCAEMSGSERWNDDQCGNSSPFVCECQ